MLDVGCGIGNISCWLAEQIGKKGHVVAIDRDSHQIKIAKKRAQNKKIENISFYEKDAEDLSEFNNQFDLTYCRSLLIHVKHPNLVVKNMAKTVCKNGILACEVTGDKSSTFYYPPFQEYLLLWEKIMTLFKRTGCDINIGLNIFKICKALANFSCNFKISHQVITEPDEAKNYNDAMCILLDSLSESLISNNILSKQEIMDLKLKLQSHQIEKDTLIFLLRTTQVWCKRLI